MSSYTFKWPSGPNEVIVTGTFDNWSKSYPLVKQTDGSFELNVPLDRSQQVLYKYVVDGEWTVSEQQKTTEDPSGIKNNVLEPSASTESKKDNSGSKIPEAGGITAASGAAAAAAASSKSDSKDVSTTVMPSTEGKQTTLGEPGIHIPKDKDALAAFETVRDVDPKTLNENKDEEFTKELTPEERKKQKKKLKKTQYKLRKKQQKKAAAVAGGGAVGGAGASATTTGDDENGSYNSDEEKSPEPETENEASVTGAILGAVGGAAAGGVGGALVGALGGATAGHAVETHADSEDATANKAVNDEAPHTLDPGRKAQLDIPGSITGVDRTATNDSNAAATKTKTADTSTSAEYVDTQESQQGGPVGTGVAAIPEAKNAEEGLEKQKENTTDIPLKGDLTSSGAAAVPVTAVYENKKEPSAAGVSSEQAQHIIEENTKSYPAKADNFDTAATPVTAVEKSLEPQVDESKDKSGAAAAGAAGAAGVVGGTAAAQAATAPATQSAEPGVQLHSIQKENAPAAVESSQPRAEGGEVAGVFGSGHAVAPDVGPKEVSAKEVDAAPVTKGDDHRFDAEDEIIIAQGGENVKQVEKRIIEQEGDVSVEQIQPSPSEARRLAEEAHLLKQAQLAAERAQEVASPTNPSSGPVKPEKALLKSAPKSPKKAQKEPNAAQQQATKTKKGFLSKLKNIFK